jgi:hypothetical protein
LGTEEALTFIDLGRFDIVKTFLSKVTAIALLFCSSSANPLL